MFQKPPSGGFFYGRMEREITADEIVAAARSWIGTRFHYQGRVKKTAHHRGGVDCLGLFMGVARELNLKTKHGFSIADFDRTDYSQPVDAELFSAMLAEHLEPVKMSDIHAGFLLMFKIKNSQQHIGIAGIYNFNPEEYSLIHSYAQARRVVETVLDQKWRDKIVSAYRLV